MSDADIAMRVTLDTSGAASGFQSLNGHLNDFGIKTNTASASLGPLGTVLGSLASPMTMVAGAAGAVGMALAGSVQAAAAWETAMAGVAKTTGMSGPALQSLSQELLTMSSNMPTAAAELGQIAAVAGSLGVAKENIAGFTEAAAMMAVGFAMPAEQAATQAAKILTAFGKPIDTANMMALGNVVNSMGDNFAATEAQVLDFVSRASYLNTTFGLGIPAVAAWGTALISVGVDSEVAATGIKSMMNLSLDPKKFDAFAKAAGMSAVELRESLNKDVAGTYEMVAEKIAGGSDAVEKFGTISKLVGTEGMTVFTKMGGAAYQSADALAKANAEWTNGSSLMKTYETQSATVNSQWVIFTNTVNQAAVELGTVLLPAVSDVLQMMTATVKAGMDVADTLGGWGDQIFGKEAEAAVLDFFGGTGNANRKNEISAKEMATQTAGVYGDYLAKGIAENDALAKAPGEALTSPEAKKAAEDSAKDWIKNFGGAMVAGMTEAAPGIWASWDEISRSSIAKTFGGDGKTDFELSAYKAKTNVGVDIAFDYALNSFQNIGKIVSSDGKILAQNNNMLGSHEPGFKDQVRQLIEDAGLTSNEGNIMDITPNSGSGDVWRFKNSVTMENEWDVVDETKSITKFMDANRAMVENGGGQLGLALYNALNNEIVKGSPTLQESLGYVMSAIAEPGSVPVQKLNLALADLIDAEALGAAWKVPIQDAANKAIGELNWLGKGKLELPSLTTFLLDPKAVAASGINILDYVKGTFLPEMVSAMKEAQDLLTSGMPGDQIYDAYVKPLEAISEYLPPWLQGLMASYEAGTMDFQTFLDSFSVNMDLASQKIKDQTVGYDQLKAAIKDCADCATSEFGEWQEAQDNLFTDAYIGPGGSAYVAWKAAQQERVGNTQAGMWATGQASADMTLGLNTTEADQIANAFKNGVISMNPKMTIGADISQAKSDVDNLFAQIQAMRPRMQVQIDVSANAGQIYAIVQQAVAEAINAVG
jgi:TP901 family phage tail tape measure protein